MRHHGKRHGHPLSTPSSRPADAGDDVARIRALADQAGESVQDVLQEVADFRLALETDFIVAAAAADLGAADLAAEVVDNERDELARFRLRMLDRLDSAAAAEDAARAALPAPTRLAPVTVLGRFERLTRRTQVAAAAAAVAGLVAGVSLSGVAQSPRQISADTAALALADRQLDELAARVVLDDATTGEIVDVAAELHATLDALITQHAPGDPEVARQVARLLQKEQTLLMGESPRTVSAMLNRVALLARKLTRMAPPSAVPVPFITEEPDAKRTAKPSPKPTKSSKPSPKPTKSSKPSPKPTPSAKPSSSSPSPSASSEPVPTTLPGDDNKNDESQSGPLPV